MSRRPLAALVVLALPLSAAAAPLDTLKDFESKLGALGPAPAPGSAALAKWRAGLESAAKDAVDFEELARRALGSYWSTGTAAEQSEFVALFAAEVRDAALSRIAGARGASGKITFGAASVAGAEAAVPAVVEGRDPTGKLVRIDITWRLILRGSKWLIYDYEQDGDTLAAIYGELYAAKFKGDKRKKIAPKTFREVLDELRSRAAP
jgi:ABC-type transporter MlaC component